MVNGKDQFGEFLITDDMLSRDEYREAHEESESADSPLSATLLDLNMLTDEELARALGDYTGHPLISLDNYPRDPGALDLLSEEDARTYRALPLLQDGGALVVAMSDPLDLVSFDNLKQLTGYDLEPVIARRDELDRYLDRWYGSESSDRSMPDIRLMKPDGSLGEVIDGQDPDESRGVAVGIVNRFIEDAIQKGASNVHINPRQDHAAVSFRIDGTVRPQTALPGRLHRPVLSRFKVLADRYRKPEIERPSYRLIRLKFGDEPVTLRLNTVETRFGEKLNLKVCRGSNFDRRLTELGLDNEAMRWLERLLDAPRGLLIYSGPSDSGKTTSLYASLRYLAEDPANIITVEHPVEYELDFCSQIEATSPDPETHASTVYDALKVDPDVLMISDMGEPEVARSTLYAAATGRKVLSSYYADNAIDALYHLSNTPGVDRYQLANSTVGVVAQRLVRLLREDARQEFQPSDETMERFDLPGDETYYRVDPEVGQPDGYRGVTGIFQVLPITDPLRMCILEQKPYRAFQEAAQDVDLPTLREKGLQKVYSGQTTIDEVCRVTYQEDLTQGLSVAQ